MFGLYGGLVAWRYDFFGRYVVEIEEQGIPPLVLCPAPGWLLVCRGESIADRRGVLPRGDAGGLAQEAELEVRRRARDFLGKPLDVVYSGADAACLTSARILGGGDYVAVHADARLNDLDYGIWSGRPTDEMERIGQGSLWERWRSNPVGLTCPKGESFHHLWERCAEFLMEAGRVCEGMPGYVMVVAPAWPIAVLACLLEQRPPSEVGELMPKRLDVMAYSRT